LKGWKVVKIISFVLVLVLSFTILNRALAILITSETTRVHPRIVFTDLSFEQPFAEQEMQWAAMSASTVAYFGSQEAIVNGARLQWTSHRSIRIIVDHAEYYFSDFSERDLSNFIEGQLEVIGIHETESVQVEELLTLRLITPNGAFHFAHIEVPLSDFQETEYVMLINTMRTAEANAIDEQLRMFRLSLDSLNRIDGLIFYISSEIPAPSHDITIDMHSIEGGASYTKTHVVRVENQTFNAVNSNIDESEQSLEFFETQPINSITAFNRFGSKNTSGRNIGDFRLNEWMHGWNDGNTETFSVHLAFTQEFVDARLPIYSAARSAYITNFSIIILSILLILGLVVVLLVSVGREYIVVDGIKVRSKNIRFFLHEKVYLDLGLVLLIGWIALIVYLSFVVLLWLRMPTDAIIPHSILFIAAVLLAVPPILLWLMNVAKRIKAGKFWKHTLVYAILANLIYRSLRYCVRTVRSLWSGARLTGKVAIISVITFFILLFTGIFSFNVPVFIIFTPLLLTPLITFFLLRYAKRIRNLELGVQRVCGGDYDNPIDVGSGELGNIANSINSISTGIHEAVEERMKSERLKTELITNVSHDIRTPLTSIITYTDLLEHEGLDCEKAPEYLDVLKKKSLRLKSLTDELFEAAKAVSGNIDVNLTELNIGSLIKQVLGELDESIKESGLDIRTNLPEKIYGNIDGKLTQRILENLLSNVFKYSMPNSRVYLDLYPIDSRYARIEIKSVSATELNFDPAELTERFKRGDNSRTDGGSGLGLSIVESFVTAQNGRFDIAIDGDLFKAMVTLPMAQRAQPSTPDEVIIKD